MGLLDSLSSYGSGILGSLGGGGNGWSNAADGYFQNNQNSMLGLAAGLLQPTTAGFGGALSQGLQGYMAGRPEDRQLQERSALTKAAAGDTTLTPQMRSLLQSSPELAKAYLSQNLLNPNQNKMSDLELKQKQFEVDNQGKPFPTWGEIGTNPDGSKQYGWINQRAQTVTPAGPVGGNGSMFSNQSVDGQALNELVRTGKLTREQAATYAASKPSTNPANGSVSLITPMAINGGLAPVAGAPTPQMPGVIDVTTGKPGGNLTEAQQKAKMLAKVIDPEVDVVDKNFSELGSLTQQGYGSVPILGNYMTSPSYKQATNSLKTIISSYLYVTSGATTTPKELDNQAALLTPKPGDDPATIAQKLARIHTMADAVKGVAGGQPATPQTTQATPPQLAPGQTWQHPSGVTIQRLGP